MINLLEFEELIKRRTGIAAETLGASTIESALKRRLQACELKDTTAYLERLRGSEAEMQALIDEVVVPETWFFRNREAFDALAREAPAKWSQSEGSLRLLSLPCSTGEEPYSMSMALLDVGIPASAFTVDAVDICAQSIALARAAQYGSNSFRGKLLEFRDRYFSKQDKLFSVADQVKKLVYFRLGNMLNPHFMPESGVYDFIFCRNVLIYFDRETQDKAVKVLERLLKKNGVLFVGPSESGLLLEHNFASAQWPLAFAFVKKALVAPMVKPLTTKPAIATPAMAAQRKMPAPAPATLAAVKAKLVAKPAAPLAEKTQATPATSLASSLSEISTLADKGQLKEALFQCDALMRSSGQSVQVFHLMALLHDASGNIGLAEQFYRKVLYLDPRHSEAIAHFAYLLEKRGDSAAAATLRKRLQRLSA